MRIEESVRPQKKKRRFPRIDPYWLNTIMLFILINYMFMVFYFSYATMAALAAIVTGSETALQPPPLTEQFVILMATWYWQAYFSGIVFLGNSLVSGMFFLAQTSLIPYYLLFVAAIYVISWSLYPPSDIRGWILPWKKPYVSLLDWEGKQIGFIRSQLRKKELVAVYLADHQEEISTDRLIQVGNKLLLLPPEIDVFLKTPRLVETGSKRLNREEIREKTLKVIEEVERFKEDVKNIRKELMRLEGIILLEGKRDIIKRKELVKRKDKLGIMYGLRRKQVEMLDNTIEKISPFLELYEPGPIKRKGRMYRFELGN